MPDALPKTKHEPEYLRHFGLASAPFARLGDPADLFLTEQYSFLLAHLANATEQPDSVVVICGQSGSGKTSLLNRFITSIDSALCFASISEVCENETDFFISVLRQFGFGDISGTIDELRLITREFLIQQGKAGDPVLLLIDNAHLLNPKVFEQLRWVVSIKHHDTTVANLILAGHPDLAKIMDSPAMSQISARTHVQFNIRAYTEDEAASYIWHRLELAGDRHAVQFADEVHALIYRYTGGNPRLINVLCDAALAEAHEAGSSLVTGDMLRQAAKAHQLVPHAVPLQNKSRRKTDPGYKPPEPADTKETVTRRRPPEARASKPERQQQATAAAPPASESARRAAAKAEPSPPGRGTRREIKALKREIEKLEAEALEYREAETGQAGLVAELEARLNEKAHAMDMLAADLEGRAKENKAARRRVEKLKAEALKSQEAANEQARLVAELEAKLDEKAHAMDMLVADLESSARENTAARQRIDKLSGRLAKQDKTTAKLAADLSARRAAIRQLESNLSEANEKLIGLEGLEEGFRAAQQQLFERERETTTLRSEVSRLKRDASHLEEELGIASARLGEIETLKHALAGLEDEARARSAELNSLKRRLAEQEDHAGKLEGKLRDAESRLGAAEHEAGRVGQLENDLGEQRGEAETLREHLSAREDELKDAWDELEKRAAANRQLERDLSRAAKIAAELEQQVSENDRLSALVSEKEEELRSLHDLVQEKAETSALYKTELARIGKLETELEEATKASSSLRDEIAARDTSLRDLEMSLDEEKEETRWLKSEVKRLREVDKELAAQAAHSKTLASENSEKEARIGQLTSELDASRSELEQTRDSLRRLEQAEAELGSARSRIEELGQQLDASHFEGERLRARIAEQAQALDDLRALEPGLKEAEERLSRETARAEGLEEQLTHGEARLEEMSVRLAEQLKLEDAANEKIAQLVRLESEMVTAHHAIDELEKTIDAKSSEAASMETQLHERDQHISSLQGELGQLKELANELRGQLAAASEKDALLGEKDLEIERLARDVEEREALRRELEARTAQYKDLQELVLERDERFAILEGEFGRARSALNEAQECLASQAVELSDAHGQAIRATDLEEALAKQMEVNSALQNDLEEQSEIVRELEEKLTALEASQQVSDEETGEQPRSELEEALARQLEINAALQRDLEERTEDARRLEEQLVTLSDAGQPAPDQPSGRGPRVEPIHISEGSVSLAISRNDELEEEIFEELEDLRFMIGRSHDNDITLNSDTVSRHHALMVCKDGYLTIEDLNSTNGVDINGRRIVCEKLRPNDRITVGEYEIRVRTEDSD